MDKYYHRKSQQRWWTWNDFILLIFSSLLIDMYYFHKEKVLSYIMRKLNLKGKRNGKIFTLNEKINYIVNIPQGSLILIQDQKSVYLKIKLVN
jgi:hypothetical protein